MIIRLLILDKIEKYAYSFLCSKFSICHQVYFIGEVHGHCQFDQKVNAKSVATLGNNWASCNQTRKSEMSFHLIKLREEILYFESPPLLLHSPQCTWLFRDCLSLLDSSALNC